MYQYPLKKLQTMGAEHALYRCGGHTLEVRKEGDSWTCLHIPKTSLVGIFLAHGNNDHEALRKGLGRLTPVGRH